MKRLYSWYPGLIFLVVLLLAFDYNTQTTNLVRYPYLQNVTEDSAVIVWTTDEQGDSVVEYGPTPDYKFKASGDANTTKHVVFIKDLFPDTVYYYRVQTKNILSDGDTFKTANSPKNPYFKMVVFGDSGECTRGRPRRAQRALADQIKKIAPDLLLHTGDIIYPNGEQWGYDLCYFPIYRDTIKSVPLFPSPGNRDYNRPSFLAPYLENFYVPENVDNPEHVKRYYSFNYANAHFFALDTELVPDGVANADQQWWFENDLANATDAVWKFIYFHRPPFSAGRSGSNISVRNVIAPLAEKYNVDIVFTGHVHHYERTHPILNNKASDNGVVYIVTGGGGADLSNPGRESWTAFSGRFHHVLEVQVESQTLTLETVEANGARQDKYTLVKGTLTGNITNTQGNAIPNATVKVLLGGRQRAIMPGTADGGFYFSMAEGAYDVVAEAPGCQEQVQKDIRIAEGAEAEVNFVLDCQ